MKTENIKVYNNLMGENEKWAEETRKLLKEKNVRMVNFIGSPGAGKTALLESMANKLNRKLRLAVLEGDVATTRDAERITALGIPASQLLTDGACHLEAKLVHYALRDLELDELDLVIVENVGNMVCPAEFDIGEKAKIAVLSVTEGEDKPLKYPVIFHDATASVITKNDLLEHLSVDMDKYRDSLNKIHPNGKIFELSALTGNGMDSWLDYLESLVR